MEIDGSARVASMDENGGGKQLHSLKGVSKHVHGFNCRRMLKHILYKDEEILLEIKQSYLEALSPAMLVATNKRLIIIYPSFFGLYLGYDLVHPTTYSLMPYKYMIGVSISNGKILSSLKIHTSGSIDSGSQIKDEGEIHGIRSAPAILLTNVIGEILQFTEQEHVRFSSKTNSNYERKNFNEEMHYTPEIPENKPMHVPSINLETAKEMIKTTNVPLIWLGVESNIYLSKLLEINYKSIKTLNIQDVERYKDDQVLGLEGAILLSYDGLMSSHLSAFLKDKYGIVTYVVKGGLYAIMDNVEKRSIDN